MKKGFEIIGVLFLAGVMSSCLNSDDGTDAYTLLTQQVATIDAYLAANNISAIEDINGIRIVIDELGTGFPAKASSTVKVDYVGKLFDGGTTFDQGTVNGVLSGYIDGWQLAFTTIPGGSKGKLYIPSIWGYGSGGAGSIPGDAILVFDFNFHELTRTSTELDRLASDTVAIDDYLDSKGIVATKDTSGLRYVITSASSGPQPTIYSKVKYTAVYRLLTDDTKVVGTGTYSYEPSSSTHNRVIDQQADGIKLGLTKLAVGSKATFYVPSLLAYGTQGAGDGSSQLLIPANANVIIEVELKEIVTE